MRPRNVDPLRRGVPKASRRHGWVEAESFVQDAVEMVEILQALEIVDGGEGGEFGANELGVGGAQGEVVEGVDEGEGDGVAALEMDGLV